MRRLVLVLLIVIVGAGVWLWRGRDLSMLIDRFKTIETLTRPARTIVYEGNGTGGILHVDDLDLSLNETQLGGPPPNIGTTKDGQVALSFVGKVFPFGPAMPGSDTVTTVVPTGDTATVSIRRSGLPWPIFFGINV